MNDIIQTFRRLRREGEKACIPYITAGDPDLGKTLEVLDFFADHGADIIEIGVPFSDPMADGPVIQRAMERALKSGTTLKGILDTVRSFKNRHAVPVVLMGYYNPFWAYGIENFAKDAGSAGIDAVLTVDLPPEEAGKFTGLLWKRGIPSIFLTTPVTDRKRLHVIKRHARGFIYFVSVTGVTGERSTLPADIKEKIEEVKSEINLPVVLGFGISGADIIRKFFYCTDGFVVGSALVKRWKRAGLSDDKETEFRAFFKDIVNECHRTF